ncbi:zinc ribbon domain-containing protein [Caviibacterium pharyngocola]|uniref:UPF0547 domain-containing protein n=1 Tax=Caviibacterium pharyngocola TaxID=28159 RepID=A0A2M8RUQ2_9PAST|nr:zinc ribbon domain-containing protein [Caviibacterium pharyngocola]PJG82614.1 hypothetical protein CVP04_08330 [Caviibacterium pharyngocola]
MALHRCPECRRKVSENAQFCPHCGFSFQEADLAVYRQKLEQRRLENQEINRKSAKIHLIWLAIFVIVIACASLWQQ